MRKILISMSIISTSLSVRTQTSPRFHRGARKDERGNEPVGSCVMCDAHGTGLRALEGKNCRKMAGQNKIL